MFKKNLEVLDGALEFNCACGVTVVGNVTHICKFNSAVSNASGFVPLHPVVLVPGASVLYILPKA
jgi:hypothetical protein